jgi:hypothetical protein
MLKRPVCAVLILFSPAASAQQTASEIVGRGELSLVMRTGNSGVAPLPPNRPA